MIRINNQKIIVALCLVGLCGCSAKNVKSKEPNQQRVQNNIAYINFQLPNQIKWVENVNKKTLEGEMMAEWGVSGYSVQNTPLRVTYNRIVPAGNINVLLNRLVSPLKQSCADLAITQLSPVSSYSTQSGVEVICSRLGGNNFGVLAKFYAFSDVNAQHLVGSEVRIPVSKQAGVLTFNNEVQRTQVKNAQAGIALMSEFMSSIKVCDADNQCM